MEESIQIGKEVLEGTIDRNPSRSALSLDNEGVDSAVLILRKCNKLRIIKVGNCATATDTFFQSLMVSPELFSLAVEAILEKERQQRQVKACRKILN